MNRYDWIVKMDYGDTKGTEVHGEKERKSPYQRTHPNTQYLIPNRCLFSVSLRALRVSVVTLFFMTTFLVSTVTDLEPLDR